MLAKNRGSNVGNDTDEAQVIIQVEVGNRLLRWSGDSSAAGPALCLTLHSDKKQSKEEESLKGRMSVSTDPCSLSSLSSLTQSAWGYFERQNSSYKSTY